MLDKRNTRAAKHDNPSQQPMTTGPALAALANWLVELRRIEVPNQPWDRNGILANLRKIDPDVPLHRIGYAATKATADPRNDTPAVLHHDGAHWHRGQSPCPRHPAAGSRIDGECAGCHADRQPQPEPFTRPRPLRTEEQRAMTERAVSLSRRLWAKVAKTENCWLWTGRVNARGYGLIDGATKPLYVHRVSYELAAGPIPEGLTIDHLCRQPLCVNPAHLEAVTNEENVRRQADARTTCPQGHEYDRMTHRRNGKSQRVCSTCARAAKERGRERFNANRRARRVSTTADLDPDGMAVAVAELEALRGRQQEHSRAEQREQTTENAQ